MSEKGKNVISIFDCAGDAATVDKWWKKWLDSFKLFADAKGLILDTDKPNIARQRRAQLLHLAGPDVQDVFSTLDDTGTPTEYSKAVDALNSHFVPVANSAYARRSFRSLTHEKGETVQQFVTRLRRAAKDCEFGADADNQIRDEVIAKCNSDYIRRKLLEEGSTLTLANTLKVARQCEEVENQMATLTTSKPETVVTINRVDKRKPKQRVKGKRSSHSSNACYRCGQSGHYGKDPNCPARGKKCLKCNGTDHFAAVCKTKEKKMNCVNSEQNLSIVSGDSAFHIKDQA
ncbi:uncharacterized protein [Ptychodera flava]|uniref:uncharacterized protein n=1 Tax=Ptychodera flava TaxID=63121 RepID=UPI003969FA86